MIGVRDGADFAGESGAAQFKGGDGKFTVVEGGEGVGEFLMIFGAFAGDQNGIARLGHVDDVFDGLSAVEFDFVSARAAARKTALDLFSNFPRILPARIVRS